jgi:hypothetical protein
MRDLKIIQLLLQRIFREIKFNNMVTAEKCQFEDSNWIILSLI